MMKWTRNKRVAFVIIGAVLYFLGLYVERALNIPAGEILSCVGALCLWGQFFLPKLSGPRALRYIRIGCFLFVAAMIAAGFLFLTPYAAIGSLLCSGSVLVTIFVWFIPRFDNSPTE